MTLQEVEAKIAALKERREELDGKAFSNGVFDGAVHEAIAELEKQTQILEGKRAKQLTADLLGDVVTNEKTQAPPESASAVKLPPLPRLIGFDEVPDPCEDIEVLPHGDGFREFYDTLGKYACYEVEQIAVELIDNPESVGRGVVSLTGAHYYGLIRAAAYVLAEAKLLAALGRDRRNELQKTLLKLIKDSADGLNTRAETAEREIKALRQCVAGDAQGQKHLLDNALRRIEKLEARPVFEYMGVHKDGQKYKRGQFVTTSGSLFHCNQDTTSAPPSSDWTLAVKRGRDAAR